jgi:hypothetical protein
MDYHLFRDKPVTHPESDMGLSNVLESSMSDSAICHQPEKGGPYIFRITDHPPRTTVEKPVFRFSSMI